jgi:hypothetical protein
MESRPYSGETDVDLLVDFARAATAARWPGSTYWHVGDVVWRLFQHADVDPCQNIRLWIDDSVLAGVGWFEPPSHFEFDVRPSTGSSVIAEILHWARARAAAPGVRQAEAPQLSTTALDGDERTARPPPRARGLRAERTTRRAHAP